VSRSSLLGLIPAAGAGTRHGGEVPKQYALLGGRPLLVHAVDALLADPRIATVLVVVAPGDTRWRALAFDPRVRCAAVGGACRAQSVRNGLQELAARDEDWILVHDAARPCLAAGELARLIDEVTDDEVGGLLALPLADTLKRGDCGADAAPSSRCCRVQATVDRDGLWRALTPQMFRAGVLARALQAAGPLERITDESAAVEALGLRPRLVAGEATNIKVTTPADFPLAEAILARRGRESGER
jgi:2-C-methyl-D-erythritol 4-phosphate cytidylyltransferase